MQLICRRLARSYRAAGRILQVYLAGVAVSRQQMFWGLKKDWVALEAS